MCGSSHLVSGASLIYRTGNLCSDNETSICEFPEAVTGPAKLSREGDTAVIKPGVLPGNSDCACISVIVSLLKSYVNLGGYGAFCVSVFSFPLHFFI